MDTLIKDIRPGMRNINLTFIVLEVGISSEVKGREVRIVKIADRSATIEFCLWDEAGRFINPGDILHLTKAHANVYRNRLTVYRGKASDLDKVGEFCMEFNEELNMSHQNLVFDDNPALDANMNNSRPTGAEPRRNNSWVMVGPRQKVKERGKNRQQRHRDHKGNF